MYMMNSDYCHPTPPLISPQPLFAQGAKNKEGGFVLDRTFIPLPLRLREHRGRGRGKDARAQDRKDNAVV